MNGISSVTLVSDGILVGFRNGMKCYFATAFLKEHIGLGSNQIFVNQDPSSMQPGFSEVASQILALLPC